MFITLPLCEGLSWHNESRCNVVSDGFSSLGSSHLWLRVNSLRNYLECCVDQAHLIVLKNA
jgi:hypothetical protein